MRKLNVGDRVLIKCNVNRADYMQISYPDDMVRCMGSISTVVNIRICSWHPHGYLYDLGSGWTYLPEWIIPLEECTVYDLINNKR